MKQKKQLSSPPSVLEHECHVTISKGSIALCMSLYPEVDENMKEALATELLLHDRTEAKYTLLPC